MPAGLAEQLRLPIFCLFLKIYLPKDRTDSLLTELILPCVDEYVGPDRFSYFFFLRYADPGLHVRVRFFGPSGVARGKLRASLLDRIQAGASSHGASEVKIGRYRPEWKRYGGMVGVRAAERIFAASSRSVLDFLASEEAQSKSARVEFAITSAEALLHAIGMNVADRHRLFAPSVALPPRMDPAQLKMINEFSDTLQPIVSGAIDDPRGYWKERNPAIQVIIDRIYSELDPLARIWPTLSSELTQPLIGLASSQFHMHVNRLALFPAHERIIRFARARSAAEAARSGTSPASTGRL
jgi:thiopeptide-type bacteriocin biosynthesis protein